MTHAERRALQLRRLERARDLIVLTLTKDVVRVNGYQHPAVHQTLEALSRLIRDQEAFVSSGGIDIDTRNVPRAPESD